MAIRQTDTGFMLDMLLPVEYATWFGIPRRLRLKGFSSTSEAEGHQQAVERAIENKQSLPDRSGTLAIAPRAHVAIDDVFDRLYRGTRSEVVRAGQIKCLKKYLPNVPLEDLSTMTIDKMAYDMGKEYAPNTISGILSVLTRTIKVYQRYGLITKAPLVTAPRTVNKSLVTLQASEEPLVLAALQKTSQEACDLVTVYLDTGCRKMELLSLKGRDVDLLRGTIAVDGKTGPRVIPLTPRALQILTRRCTGRSGDLRVWSLSTTMLRRRFDAALKTARVRHMTIHDLRHSFCTRLSERNVSPFLIQKLAGHKSITTTQRYTHVNAASLQEAIRAL
jgi:integrase